jgi:hypothetical protein
MQTKLCVMHIPIKITPSILSTVFSSRYQLRGKLPNNESLTHISSTYECSKGLTRVSEEKNLTAYLYIESDHFKAKCLA